MRGLWAVVTRALGREACTRHSQQTLVHTISVLPTMARPKRGRRAHAETASAAGSRQLRVRGSAVVEATGDVLLVSEELAVAVDDGASPAVVLGSSAGAQHASVPEGSAALVPAAGRGQRRGRAAHRPPPAVAEAAGAPEPGVPPAKPARKRRKAAASAAVAAPLAEGGAAPAAHVDSKETTDAVPKGGRKKHRPRKKAKAAEEAAAEGDTAGAAEAASEPPKKKPRARKKPVQAPAESTELVPLPAAFPPGKLVGAHVSMASGMERAVVNAASIGKGRRLQARAPAACLSPLLLLGTNQHVDASAGH